MSTAPSGAARLAVLARIFAGLFGGKTAAAPKAASAPTTPLVTVDLLRRVAPGAKQADELAAAMSRLPRYGVDTPLRLAVFLAQAGHESAGFSRWVENLNYSADGLAATWPNRFARLNAGGGYVKDGAGRLVPNDAARDLHRQPRAIANRVYANRMGNGGPESDDGWRYRGRGLIQVTGRSNYAYLADHLGRPLDDALLAWLETPEGAVESACWYWGKNDLNSYADAKDFVGLTRRINGGTNGLADRKARYAAACAALGIPPT